MAHELYNSGFCFPSEFLIDDELLTDFKSDPRTTKRNHGAFSYGSGGPFGFNSGSGLNSPVESAMAEGGEGDFITWLSHKVAQSTLQGSDYYSSDCGTKGLKLCGSPHSTFRGSKSVSNSMSCFPPGDARNTAAEWDFLCAAAEEVARVRMIEEVAAFYSRKLYGPLSAAASASLPLQKNMNPASGLYPNHTQTQSRVSYQQYLQAAHYQQMKRQQMVKGGIWEQRNTGHHFQYGPRMGGSIRGGGQGTAMSAWRTPVQSQGKQLQQPSSGMLRPVFLAESRAKKEQTGTGVFMPRSFGEKTSKNREKSVLKPERMAHPSLNLNLNLGSSIGDAHLLPIGKDAALKLRNNVMMAYQNQELKLPQDWTY